MKRTTPILFPIAFTIIMLSSCTISGPANSSLTNYVISFDANGGSGNMTEVKRKAGDYVLPECSFVSPEDCYFSGWKIGNDGDVFKPGSIIDIESDVSLLAIWDPNWCLEYGISLEPQNSMAYAKYKAISSLFSAPNYECSELIIYIKGNREYTVNDIFSGDYVDNVSRIKQNSDKDVQSAYDAGLPIKMEEEHCWVLATFKKPYLIKDAFMLLSDLETNPSICYASYFLDGTGDGLIPPKKSEKSRLNETIELFNFENDGFLDGYYRNIYIQIKKEYSGEEYEATRVLPSLSVNEYSSFEKITAMDRIEELNNKIPDYDKEERDWYQISFDYKYEAQYAFSLLKTLQLDYLAYYAFIDKCIDEQIEIKPIQIVHPWSLSY